MLRAFCWLVSNVVSFLGKIIHRSTRDWHTDNAEDDQLPTPNDPTQKEAESSQPSFSGKRAARIPGIPVVSTQGTETYSRLAINQDARPTAAHGSLDNLEAELQLRVPRIGGDPVLRAAQTHMHRSARRRSDQPPAFAGDTVVRSRLKPA